jgi:ribosomal protein S6--L-glutamate ligase
MALRVGVAGVPGAWSTERMCAALDRAGVQSFTFSLADCLHDLNTPAVTLSDFDLSALDGIVVKKLGAQQDPGLRLRLHMLRALERKGVRIFSRPSVIDAVMDRYHMTMRLVEGGVPIPPTMSCESEATMSAAVQRMGSALLKPVYTSKGRGFVRLGNGAQENPVASPPGNGRALVQQFVDAPGRDIGACVVGSEFAGAFYRVAGEGQWLTSTSAGGRYAPCDLPGDGRRLAESAADLFGLDFTVVDLVETKRGYLVYEVSAFGGFRGMWEAYHRDVTTEYARYVKWELTA